MNDRSDQTVRDLPEITAATDTRDYLSHAAKFAQQHEAYDLIIDVDAHLQEVSGGEGEVALGRAAFQHEELDP